MRVLRDRGGRANAINLDALGGAHGIHGFAQRHRIEHRERIAQGLDAGMEDLAADGVHVVGAVEILMNELDRLDDFLREAELHLLETGQSDAAAEIDDAALADFRGFGQFGDGHADDVARPLQDELGDSLGALGHVGLGDTDAAERIFDGPVVHRRAASLGCLARGRHGRFAPFACHATLHAQTAEGYH